MPSPSTALASPRPFLGQSLMEFDLAAADKGFIANSVLPVLEVARANGEFGKFTIKELLKSPNTDRAPGGGYARGTMQFEKDTFLTKEQGWEEPVDDNEAKNFIDYFDAELIATQRAIDIIQRAAEVRAATLIFNATTWTGSDLTTAVGTEWSTVATSKPRDDVRAAKKKVWDGTGLIANTLIINHQVYENLIDSAQIIDRLKYAGFTDPRPGLLGVAAIAEALNIEKVIVAGAPKNTAASGLAAVIASIWDDEFAMVCRTATSQDLREPCIGRTFHWAEDGSTPGGLVESYREESARSQIIRVRHQQTEKVIFIAAGHLLANITA